jgi:hypothetical protein
VTERLQENIEQLYAVFSKYPGNVQMKGSPLYGDLEKWNRDLFSKPLRELTADDLSRFSGKVITTWGEVNDLKHFLPRILELTALLKPPYMIWVTFDRFEMSGWKSWPAEEYEAIKTYMLCLWDNLLSDESEKAEWEFDNYFSTLAHFYPGFEDLLAAWNKNTSKAATKHLGKYVYDQKYILFNKKYISGLHNKNENIKAFQSWLLSDQVIGRLEQGYFLYANEEFAETLSWAEKMLSDEKKTISARNAT